MVLAIQATECPRIKLFDIQGGLVFLQKRFLESNRTKKTKRVWFRCMTKLWRVVLLSFGNANAFFWKGCSRYGTMKSHHAEEAVFSLNT